MKALFDPGLWRRTPQALAKPPAYVGERRFSVTGTFAGRSDREAQQRAYGMHGTLFQIVNRTAFAVSTAEWGLWRKAASGRQEDRTAVTAQTTRSVAELAALEVWEEPNAFFSGQELRETLGQHFELTGEAWMVVVRRRDINLPVELWPVRPDRMHPVPSPTAYLSGYIYCDPDGHKVPLGLDEVIFIRQPSPLDTYRGMSAIGTLLIEIDGARLAREWNRNFFYNSAEPGGVIEFEQQLADHEFEEFRTRWAEQHRGVSAAHRVALLERGKWVQRAYSMKDMQFTELLNSNREAIREALGFPKPLLGAVDDVNRANADAAETVFSRWLVEPRLVRWRGAMNSRYLPMFGPTMRRSVEFDYVNPVPEDQELANATRDSKMNAARTLVVDLKATRESVIEALELPATIEFDPMPEPAPAALPPGAPAAVTAHRQAYWTPVVVPDEPLTALFERAERALPLALPAPRNEVADAAAIDLDQLQADWERELDSLLSRWSEVTTRQRALVREQIEAAVEAQDVAALAEVSAQAPDDDAGAELLALALAAMALLGAEAVVAEAAEQGVELTAVTPAERAEQTQDQRQEDGQRDRRDDNPLPELAAGTAAMLAGALALSAQREALRQYQPGAEPSAVADAVDRHLDDLSDVFLRDNLGGLLTRAQNLGRLATLAAGPTAAYYASEVLDKNTCEPCREIDGKRLPTLDAAMLAYGGSGYLFCRGTWRCRGTMVAVWGEGTE